MKPTNRILGLDLGTNSIGWVIRDPDAVENQFISKGVLHFNEGVAYIKDIEQPKVKLRTEVRGRRRNYQAEKYRKWELLENLIGERMCPLTIEELNEWRHYKKGIGRRYPTSKSFHDWVKFDFDADGKPDFERFGFSEHDNCYAFRWLATSSELNHKEIFANNPMLLGRVLYQMVQRRGFNTMYSDDPENKLIEEGRKNVDTKEIEVVGVKVIDRLIKEKYKTLGSALYWGQRNHELEDINNNRIRNRFTYRHYYANEVDLIFENLGFDLNSNFCKRAKACIVWQRPLRSQKGLVGYCTLDAPLKSRNGVYYKAGKTRLSMSHPLYEEYRTWCDINNLKIEVPIGVDRTEFLSEKVFPLFNRATNFYYSDKKSEEKAGKKQNIVRGLKHKIEELGAKVIANYDNDLDSEDEGKRYNANTFMNWLEEVFGSDWKARLKWEETLTNAPKKGKYLRTEDIWHLCYDAIETKKQRENLADRLVPIFSRHFPDITFDPGKFEKIKLSKGYASLSASTIRKILPYLKMGLIYSQAVFVANLDKVFGRKLDADDVERLSIEYFRWSKEYKNNKEVYSIVNELISDRLNERDRLNCGENYRLDELDHRDIRNKIKEKFKEKIWNRKTVADQNSTINLIAEHYQDFLRKTDYGDKSALFLKPGRLSDAIKSFLVKKFKVDEKLVEKYLWHPSEQEKYPPATTKRDGNGNLIRNVEGEPILFLGDPNPISRGFKNPMAMKALHELKKHLNYLLFSGKINGDTKIVVEIARELNDANRRRAIERWQNERRKKRDGFKKKIEEYFVGNNIPAANVSEDMLDRYELYEEQSQICLYCGQAITCAEILNGTAQKEHTIPARLSNCDELYNLTIAHAHCNAEKAKRFPSQWKERYPQIMEHIKFIYANFKRHQDIFESTFDAARSAKDKPTKDGIIQKRHYHKFHLDYWRRKYETFVIEEITNQFRKQQLTDTQIITKYTLPYLKTVFKKVEVQKGIVTDKFRKIYQIGPKMKDRSEYWHHAMDAAVLTLIPSPGVRDFLMKEYNTAVDENLLNTYVHPKPINWPDFIQNYITSFKDEIIINHVSLDRKLKQSWKKKRVRGRVVKDAVGHPIFQRGDTVRGKLHDESIFGMVKMPETVFRDGKYRIIVKKGKIQLKQNDKRLDDLFVVKRVRLSDFSSVEELEKLIVDPNLGDYLTREINRRMREESMTFEAALKGLYAFGKAIDKNGNPIRAIRHIRCKVKTGANSFVQMPAAIKEIDKAFESSRIHKRNTYALNAELPVCALYEWNENGKIVREVVPIPLLSMARAHRSNDGQIVESVISFFKGSGKKRTEYHKKLVCVMRPGVLVIFYKNDIEELKDLSLTDKIQLLKRVYRVVKFEEGKIFFDYHMTALSDTAILNAMEERGLPKKGDSRINFESPTLRLRLSQGSLNMAIQDIHFNLKSDGELVWMV